MDYDIIDKINVDKCSCGSRHKVSLTEISVSNGAINDLAGIIKRLSLTGTPSMLCDENTYDIAGSKVEAIMSDLSMPVTTCLIGSRTPFAADEEALGRAVVDIHPETSFLIAVGSGTINDITRYTAYKLGKPFITIGTATSMDGYASSVSPIIVRGVKTTLPAKLPNAIIGDIDLMSTAPDHMKAAGLGDLLGKFIAKVDWHLAHILNAESICEYSIEIVQEALKKCIGAVDPDNLYDDKMLKAIMEGLITSGLAIAMVGKSRPASGAEHHIAHFLEMQSFLGKAPDYLHGENVAVGTYVMSKLFHTVFSHGFDEIKRLSNEKPLRDSEERRTCRLTEAYGKVAPSRIENWKKWIPDQNRSNHIMRQLETNWSSLKDMVERDIPKPDKLAEIMNTAKVPFRPDNMGYSKEMIEDALICAKEISYKYTLLYTLDEIGLLEYFADQIVTELYR